MERWYAGYPVFPGAHLSQEWWQRGAPVPEQAGERNFTVAGSGLVQAGRVYELSASGIVGAQVLRVQDLATSAIVIAFPVVMADAIVSGKRLFPHPARIFPLGERELPVIP
jgi:hypothetical protein